MAAAKKKTMERRLIIVGIQERQENRMKYGYYKNLQLILSM